MNESSGFKAHSVLAPANARNVRRQVIWGDKISLPMRERFRMTKTTELAAIAGQKILFASWPSITLCCMLCSVAGGETKTINGINIGAETNAKIGRNDHLSIIAVGDSNPIQFEGML